MQINLNRQSGIPLARQIYQEIADRIRSGLLAEGSSLPSIRQLARQCRVSFMTVVQAYGMLEKEGLIVRVQGRGTFVGQEKKGEEDVREGEKLPGYDWQLTIADYLPRAQFWLRQQHVHTEAGFSFSLASPHPDLVPHVELGKAMQKAISADPAIMANYGPVQGDGELRQAVALYLAKFRLSLHPEEMIVTSGAQQGIDLVARSFIGPGDIVATESPTYSAAIDVFRGRGATILPVPVDEEGMRVDFLASLCDKKPPKLIYTVPTFHNPTGTVMSMRRRSRLLDIAQSYRSIILEDDPWSEISFGSPPPPPLKSIDENGHVIFLKSMSKILSPGCRVALLAASGTILHRLTAAKAVADLGSPLLSQRAVLSFLQSAALGKHLKQLQANMQKRKNRVIALLRQHAPDGVRWMEPRGGYNIWLTLPSWLNADELVAAAIRRNIDFLPGSACYSGEPEYNHLRISFSYMSEEKLQQGTIALCRLLAEAVSTRANRAKPPVV
jgi:DNA-binding transcriptional MocR family regulator